MHTAHSMRVIETVKDATLRFDDKGQSALFWHPDPDAKYHNF